jgi:hypothetical protein
MNAAPTTEERRAEERVRATAHSHAMPAGPDYWPVPQQPGRTEVEHDRLDPGDTAQRPQSDS